MGWNPFKKSSWDKVGDAITDTANDVADTVTDTANDVADTATNAYNATKDFAEGLANDTAKAVQHTTDTCAAQANEYAKRGFDVASDEWKNGTDACIHAVSEGVEYAEWAATEAYEWLDANACYIGLNLALTSGCVAYFTPKPDPADPGTVTSASISATYLGYAATQGANTACAVALGTIITDSIWMIPGVKGNCSKKTLKNVITNVIATCNPAVLSVSLATPAGVGIFIGSVISPIVAQLVCEKVAPKGMTKAVD